IVEFGDVKRDCYRGRAAGTNFRRGLLGRIELDIRQRHLGAFVGEPRRDRTPDSLGGASYDCDFACEAGHDATSTRDPAAVDDEWRAGGERRFVAGEEQRGMRDFVRAADAAEHRTALDEFRLQAVGPGDPIHHRRVNYSRADAVDANVVAAVLE